MDNELLVNRAKNGDQEAFEQLIIAYEKRIYNIALRTIKHRQDAEDVAQEAIIKIFRSISTFKGECTFGVWVYRIVVNTALDSIRRQKKRGAVSLDKALEEGRQQADGGDTPDQEAERAHVARVVRDAIDSLGDDYRVVLTLKDIQDLSYNEIVQITGANLGTVKSRINRARNALKKKLERNKELFSN